MTQQNNFLFSNPQLLVILLFLVFWLILLKIIHYLFGTLPVDKVPKQELCNYYNVDKKTLGKWVKYFCKETINFSRYNQQRKLDLGDYLNILIILGSPDEFPILTKKEIIDKCDGTYSSLRDSIDKYPELYGIDGATFRCLHKFPPSISQQIILQFD